MHWFLYVYVGFWIFCAAHKTVIFVDKFFKLFISLKTKYGHPVKYVTLGILYILHETPSQEDCYILL